MMRTRHIPHSKIARLGGRPSRMTSILLVVQSFLFLLYVFADGPPWVARHLALSSGRAMGGFAFWQPFTALWLHLEPRDLVFNLGVLWLIGPLLERWWGPRRLLFYFLVCGTGGLIVALIVGAATPGAIVFGSAGSAFGFLVAAIVLFPVYWVHLYRLIDLKIRTLGLIIAGFGIVGEMIAAEWLDVALSLGGALTGWVIVRRSSQRKSPRKPPSRSQNHPRRHLQVVESGHRGDGGYLNRAPFADTV